MRVHIERLVIDGGLTRDQIPGFQAALARELAAPGEGPGAALRDPAARLARDTAIAIRQRTSRS